jgi:hypothetical protein
MEANVTIQDGVTANVTIQDGITANVTFIETLPASLNWFIELVDTDYLEDANYLLD